MCVPNNTTIGGISKCLIIYEYEFYILFTITKK
jgi:hypothetical protein